MVCPHTGILLSSKGNKVMIHVIRWMNLGNIVQVKEDMQKAIYNVIPFG